MKNLGYAANLFDEEWIKKDRKYFSLFYDTYISFFFHVN